MKEFIKGYKEYFISVFESFSTIFKILFKWDKEDLGQLCACLTLIILTIILFIGIFKITNYLGRMEARKVYMIELYNGETK